ncbi:hypothetical protein DFH08DRAFT_1042825 [Mycena albidolilacea]|uniref:DUF6533 domain-containing protein n=1 Tax=Mycena albidolilacea TaxID=1033008 RepID=A0AAD7AGB1_9AGAR|nr:hypothetical protein DFH08DRAFT_1042825 [Mycena albidolilacea]
MTIAAPVFADRYISAISMVVLLYDHSLILAQEVKLIWFNSAAGAGNRIAFVVNRYVAEAVAVYVAYLNSGLGRGITTEVPPRPSLILNVNPKPFIYRTLWIFSMTSSIVFAMSHFVIIVRVYTGWDKRPSIKIILLVGFGIATCVAAVFSALAASEAAHQSLYGYNPSIDMCAFSKKPWALKFAQGAMTVFDFFIIIMTVLNALDRPYVTQADVVTSMQNDGARMFVCLFFLRLASFLVSVIGDETFFFIAAIFSWSICSVVNSRMQLRIEGLRFIRHTFPLDPDSNTWTMGSF